MVFLSQNLPLFNPVLIVEVLVNRPIQNSEEGNVEPVMKFTFGEDDLRECFGQFGRVVDVELEGSGECAYVTFQDFGAAWYAQ